MKSGERGTGSRERESHGRSNSPCSIPAFPVPGSPFPVPRSSQGFTLLEVLVAFSLLAVGLGILLAILSSGVQAVSRASQSTRAALYAESLLDSLGADRRLDAGHSQGSLEQGRYRWTLDIKPYQVPASTPAAGNTPVTPNAAQQGTAENVLLEIVLQMHWNAGAAQETLRVDTLRAYTPPPFVSP